MTQDGSEVDEIVRRLYDIIQSANDKKAVKKAVHAALYNNATMSSKPLPRSSKNAEIEEIIVEFEGDSDMSTEIDEKLTQQGARRASRRKTRKSKKQAKKTRKYSRRH
jgi:outer membrane protein assembly factor BamE (lipoprotein component of BamABCDE complex)